MTALAVRTASEADAPAAARIRADAARWLCKMGIDQWSPDDHDADYYRQHARNGCLHVAEDAEHHFVGIVTITWEDGLIWGLQPPIAGYISSLVIDRKSAGHGLGRALLTWAENFIADNGKQVARLDYVSGNAALGRYYSSAGYTPVGTRTFTNPRWLPVTLVEKALTRTTKPHHHR